MIVNQIITEIHEPQYGFELTNLWSVDLTLKITGLNNLSDEVMGSEY